MNTTVAEIAAVVATIGFFGLTCFQILLALGLPFGEAARGGTYRILPPHLRIASVFAAAIVILISILVLEKAGLLSVFNSTTVVTYGVWIITAFLGLNTIGNFISRSKLEKHMAPLLLSLITLSGCGSY